MGENSTLIAGVIRRIILRVVLPVATGIIVTAIIPIPAICGDNPSSVTESSRTYKDPVCDLMVKNLENEIAETTASLKDCDDLSPAPASASEDKSKECAKYARKLKFTKTNLLNVRKQCDNGITPDSLPKVVDNPDAVTPCDQCGENKPLPRTPAAKISLTDRPISGNVADLKASDPSLSAKLDNGVAPLGAKAAPVAAAAAGIPDPGEPYVDCLCPDNSDLGWMYLSECNTKRASSCGTVQPPPVVQPPPIVQPPSTSTPSTGSGNWFTKAGNWIKELPGKIWNGIKAVAKAVLDGFKWAADKLNDLYHSAFKDESDKCNGDYYNPKIECCKSGTKYTDKISDISTCPPPRYQKTTPDTGDYGCGKNGITREILLGYGYVLGGGKTIDNPTGGGYTSFFGACYQHDRSYDACNKGPQGDAAYKAEADQAFRSRMYAVCNGPDVDVVEKAPCNQAAETYFMVVSNYGNSFYQGAQLENCKCCPLGASP